MLRPTDNVRDALKSAAEAVAVALDGSDYTADHLARECEAGRALCVVPDSGSGVVIVKPNINRRTGDTEMVVWLAASAEPVGAFERYMPEIERLGRDLGAARIVFSSFRRGWLRKAVGDWKLREMVFERDLTAA